MLASLVSRLSASGASFRTTTCHHNGESNLIHLDLTFPEADSLPLIPNLPEKVRDLGPRTNGYLHLVDDGNGEAVQATVFKHANGQVGGVETARLRVNEAELIGFVQRRSGLEF